MSATKYFTRKVQVHLGPGQKLGFRTGKGYYVAPPNVKLPLIQTPTTVLIREQLVSAELAAAKLGIHEVGGDNHGPLVAKFLAEVGLPQGYPWCAAFQSYELHQVAGHKMPIESASVANIYAYAKERGWLVEGHFDGHTWRGATPARGDIGCVNWEGAGPPYGDHVFLVVEAVKLGVLLTLDTVEGNTSSGMTGSQSDGDGVYTRTRVIPAANIAFVRIPGSVPA